MNTRFKKFLSISPLKIGLIIILGIVFLYFLDFSFLRFMELKMYDLRMASRGDRKPGGEVVIAAIDEKSLSELGRWPWSRAIIANLVNTLKQNGAKAVGFDVVFSEPDNQASQKFFQRGGTDRTCREKIIDASPKREQKSRYGFHPRGGN